MAKGHKEILRNVHYLDCVDSFMHISVCVLKCIELHTLNMCGYCLLIIFQ